MKIAVFGATGWIGGTIANEALSRGHHVTAIVRDPARLQITHEHLNTVVGDAANPDSIAAAVAGHDAVVASISGRRDSHPAVVPEAAQALLQGLPRAGVKRLVWVGGASSLEVAPGLRLVDTPEFPDDWKVEALPQVEALEIFRSSDSEVDWSFFSPAAMIEPGQRTGIFRLGGDQLITDEKGNSRISVEDYAVALINELENPAHSRKRFTVGY